MKRLLQVLTIVVLVLSLLALGLGSMLFGKRELLKGRTLSLEKALVQLGALLEAPAEPELKPVDFAEKDVGEVSAQPVADPELASFWKDYPQYLEDSDLPTLTVRREDLMNLYKLDPISGRPTKDASGYMVTEGEGTMDAALKSILDAAQQELDRLNQTRHQLRRVREELVATITELNDGKQRLRASLGEINSLNGQIAGLQDEVNQMQAKVAALEEEKQTLTDDLAAQEAKVQEMTSEIQIRDETITAQREKIAALTAGGRDRGPVMAQGLVKNVMEAGRKGKVVSVNQDWSYVVLELDDQALGEIEELRDALSKNQTPGIPTVEMFLKRGDTYVSKIKLVQVKPDEKLAIADVLVDWQQMPVAAGDIAFY